MMSKLRNLFKICAKLFKIGFFFINTILRLIVFFFLAFIEIIQTIYLKTNQIVWALNSILHLHITIA